MKYWIITCYRGHMETGYNTEIKFAIKATNIIKAQDIARKIPSVKHTRMIIFGHKISAEEYFRYRKVSTYERYGQKKYGY